DDIDVPLEQHRDTLKAIHSSALFMLEIVSDVLELSLIESGGQSLRLGPVDLRSLIEESITVSRPLAGQKGIHIDARCQESTPVVIVDSRKVLQVLQNIIGNAVKYSPVGARIELSCTHDGESVSITVQDNGPGIPNDELTSIFTPFRRSRVAGV